MKNKEIPQDFYNTLKDSPKEVIEWAKKEIALYEELITIVKKQIAFEKSLPKLSKKQHELPRKRSYKVSDLFS